MKKIVAIVSLFFLFGTTGITQNKIDKATFEHLVDYANCKYTAAYIETFRNDPKEQDNIKKYDYQLKSKIENSTYDNPVPFDVLSELLKKCGWAGTEKKISAKINEKKQKFQGNEMDASAVIDLLKLDGNLATILQTSVDGLLKEVKEKYKSVTPKQYPEAEQKPTAKPTPESTNFTSAKEHSHIWLWLALIANWLVLILLFFMLKKRRGNSKELDREKIITTVLESQRIAAQFVLRESYSTLQSIKQLDDKIELLKTQIKVLQEKESNGEKKNLTEEKVISAKTKTDDSIYFKSKNGKILSEELLGIEGASFKVFNINGSEANFIYCGGVVNQDFFTDVCSFANNPSDVPNKSKIITSNHGVVKKDSNNKWEVTERATIKFI